MRKFLIASHSKMAEGIKDTLEFIVGKQDHVKVLTAYEDEDFDMENELKTIFSSLSENDELVAMVDVLGGSVCNDFSKYLDNKNFYLISGVNLPMVLTIVSSSEPQTDILVKQAIEEARSGIQLLNSLLDDFKEDDL